MARNRAFVVSGLLLAAIGVTGCQSAAETASVHDTSPVVAAHTSAPTTVATTTSPPTSPSQSVPAQTTAVARRAGAELLVAGVVLPNHRLTPGAVNPTVTQATIGVTICRTGYTKTIRPSSSYTTALKRAQLASGYSFHGDLSTSDYEEDHLISLELGGSPASVKNLWPEPYVTAEGARVKDRIENRLHDLVCSRTISLRAAQQAIAGNWWAAYQRYGGSGAPTVWVGSYSSGATSGTTSTSGTSTAGGPTAQCRDGSYSYSQHRSGTCSHHGGVDHWINPPPG